MIIKHQLTQYPQREHDPNIIDVLIARYRNKPVLLNNVAPLTGPWVLRRVRHKLQALHDTINTMSRRAHVRNFRYNLEIKKFYAD